MPFHHMLVPTDGSENSVQAAQLAFRLAPLCGAQLSIIFVVDSAVVTELARFADHEQEEVRRELFENGRHYLDHLEAMAHAAGLTAGRLVREGIPFEEIVAAADRLPADLIVMGHVGQRGPRRILIGSVTDRVIETAHCPVLVVKV